MNYLRQNYQRNILFCFNILVNNLVGTQEYYTLSDNTILKNKLFLK